MRSNKNMLCLAHFSLTQSSLPAFHTQTHTNSLSPTNNRHILIGSLLRANWFPFFHGHSESSLIWFFLLINSEWGLPDHTLQPRDSLTANQRAVYCLCMKTNKENKYRDKEINLIICTHIAISNCKPKSKTKQAGIWHFGCCRVSYQPQGLHKIKLEKNKNLWVSVCIL